LVAGIGVGARYGWQTYQDGQTDPEAVAAGTAFPASGGEFPTEPIERPERRYIDLIIQTGEGQDDKSDRYRRDLVTGDMAYDRTWQGEAVAESTSEWRDGTAYHLETVLASGEPRWSSGPGAPGGQPAALTASVLMFHDLIPPEMIYNLTIVDQAEVELELPPIEPPLRPEPGNPIPPVPSVPDETPAPRSIGTHYYAVSINTEYLASGESEAFADWLTLPGPWHARLPSEFAIWVEDSGVVRQIRYQHGDKDPVTITYSQVTDELADFMVEPIAVEPHLAGS
ncbi:MAG: hypothetical protein ACR2O6_06615, partial [Ilumatobacteraceae bacterium]